MAADLFYAMPEVQFAFIDCSPYLIRLYERIGFRLYAPHFCYDATGVLSVPMCLVMSDEEHLSRTRSALLKLARRHARAHDQAISEFFHEQWEGQPAYQEAALDEEIPIDPHLHVDPAPSYADIPLFEDVDEPHISEFLSACRKVEFTAGQTAIASNDPSTDVYLLTRGYVEVTKETHGRKIAIATLGPGELIGEMNMLLNTGRTASVVALTKAQAIVISEETFRSLFEKDPVLVARINLNLARILARRLRFTANLVTQSPAL
jgi:hypothetical protein